MSSSAPGSRSPYRLDDLGWLQFDRLCGLVLDAEAGMGTLNWRGQSDTWRVATVEEPLVLRSRRVRLHAPVTVVAFWVPDDAPAGARLSELVGRVATLLDDAEPVVADEVLVLTNLPTVDAGAALRAEAFGRRRRLVVIGADGIGASLDREPDLRLAMPSVLGLRDLGPLLGSEVCDRSSFDIAAAQELARVFWPTRAYQRALAVLRQHRFVVLTGPPEMGKTAIAQMLALAQLTDGWEAHECTDPYEVWRVFDPDRRQVFIADDAFGSTEYRPDSAERWALGLGRLLRMLDSHHWLIWTSRPAPLKAGLRRVQRERGSAHFPAPGEVLVDASDLDLEEKTVILFRHAKARGASIAARRLLRSAGLSIIEHPHFTPERIRRFVTDRLEDLPDLTDHDLTRLGEMVERELASPTEAMRNSFRALAPEHRDLLISLLDAPAGLIDERELASSVRRHHPGGLSRAPGELVDRLTDHFLRVTPLGIGWVHPSWRDLVIDQLQVDASARQHFLAVCGVEGVTLALSRDGGGSGERQLPLLENDADWDRLGDRLRRLVDELEPRDVARVLLALDGALAAASDRRQQVEGQSLATCVLDTTRQGWDQRHQVLPAFLLDTWYRLRDHLPADINPPRLSATWAELHPGSLLLEHPDCDELMRADEWLAVAQVLSEHDPAALETLGFLARDQDLLAGLIVTLTTVTAAHEGTRALAENVLKRIQELVPELAASAQGALTVAGLAEDLERERWWTPQDIAAPPSNDPAAARTAFTTHDVDRVLSDL